MTRSTASSTTVAAAAISSQRMAAPANVDGTAVSELSVHAVANEATTGTAMIPTRSTRLASGRPDHRSDPLVSPCSGPVVGTRGTPRVVTAASSTQRGQT